MSDTGRDDERTAEPIILPAHIENTVQAIARLHAAHRARATPLQRLVERATARAGRPAFVALLTVLVVAWMALNSPWLRSGARRSTSRRFSGCKA